MEALGEHAPICLEVEGTEVHSVSSMLTSLSGAYSTFRRGFTKERLLRFWLVGIVLTLAGCEQNKPTAPTADAVNGELTRELAESLLNKSFGSDAVVEVALTRPGYDELKGLGLLQTGGTFTDPKAIEAATGMKVVSGGTRLRLAKVNANVFDAIVPRKIKAVTGIATNQLTGHKEVEYVFENVFKDGNQEIVRCFERTEEAQATFRKYDDGWRIVKE